MPANSRWDLIQRLKGYGAEWSPQLGYTQRADEFLPMLGIDPHSLTIQSVSWSPCKLNLPCCRYNAKRVFSKRLCALRHAHYRFNGFNGLTPLTGLHATHKYFPIALHDTMSINSSFRLIF